MRFSTWCVALACASALFVASCSTDPVNPDGTPVGVFNVDNASAGDLIPDQYIVVFRQGAGVQGANVDVDALVRDITTGNSIPASNVIFVYKTALRGFAVGMTAAQAQSVRKDTRVSLVEQDQVVRISPTFASKEVETVQAQTTPWGITRVGGSASGSGKVAWIIDTGIDLDHTDLNVDVTRSRTFGMKGTDAKSADDLNGHGTHVSGIIAAKDNSSHVIGVAAGASVVPVKVLNRNGSGSTSGVIAGIDYVAANGAVGDVANMSLGGGASTALDDAVSGAATDGIIMVLAAGNSGADAGNYSPSRVNGDNIYTISAIDANDNFASWSNYGNPPVDYAAPGVSILSLWKGNKTATLSGTSMAAPHVAGVLLLGAVATDGYAINDPDAVDDPIAHK